MACSSHFLMILEGLILIVTTRALEPLPSCCPKLFSTPASIYKSLIQWRPQLYRLTSLRLHWQYLSPIRMAGPPKMTGSSIRPSSDNFIGSNLWQKSWPSWKRSIISEPRSCFKLYIRPSFPLTCYREKMYKTRIKQWGLDKKHEEKEMRAIVRKTKTPWFPTGCR